MTATELIETYIAIWNETDTAPRREMIARAWAPEASYQDPVLEAQGHDAIDAMVGGFHAHFPGLTFVLTGEIEAHHDRLRFTWDLLAPDGSRQAAGTDVAVLAPDGRLLDVTGFFDLAPVLPDAVTEGATA